MIQNVLLGQVVRGSFSFAMKCAVLNSFSKSLLRFFVDLPVHSYQWHLLRSSLIFQSFDKAKVVASAAIVADQPFTT